MHHVGIINYGMGNIRSVQNAFSAIEIKASVLDSPSQITECTHLVLPGVGAFPDGMRNLSDGGWIEPLTRYVTEERMPFLGICLGLQLLASWGTEHERTAGLGWIDGEVLRIRSDDPTVRVPHMGWNDVQIDQRVGVFHREFKTPGVFYFVHSYHLVPADSSVIDGRCVHGTSLVASVWKDNIFAVQFHPEKSQKAGLQVLRNFVDHPA